MMLDDIASILSDSISKLDGSNYTVWSIRMKAIFCLYNLSGIVDGIESAPSDPEELVDFLCRSDQARSLIILSLEESLHHLIDGHNTAKDLWDCIKKRYEKPTPLTIFLTYKRLHRFTITEDSPIRPQLNTLCRYRYEVIKAGIQINDLYFSFCILQSLPDSYSSFISIILQTTDLENIKPDVIEAKILQEEARRSLSAFNNLNSQDRSKANGTSRHCQKGGNRSRGRRTHKNIQ